MSCNQEWTRNITKSIGHIQEYFSRLIGTIKTEQRSVSANYGPDGEVYGYAASINEVREHIVDPEELGTLENNFILITPKWFCRVDKALFADQRYHDILVPPRKMMSLDGFSYKI